MPRLSQKRRHPTPGTAALWPWPSLALAEQRGPVSAKGGRVSPVIHTYYTTSEKQQDTHPERYTHSTHNEIHK